MKEELLSYPNVIGVGIGYKVKSGVTTDELSSLVLVRKKLPREALSLSHQIPSIFEGFRTDVVEVGDVKALLDRNSFNTNHQARYRPAPPGVSIGHYKVTAGTFGCTVKDRETGKRLILSNNHVLANSNDARQGDMILQPGAADGGSYPIDLIGALLDFVPIAFNQQPGDCDIAEYTARLLSALAKGIGSAHRLTTSKVDQTPNKVDAAVALPSDDEDIGDEILGIGSSQGVTSGTLIAKNVTISVSYGVNKMATFIDQYMFTPILSPGDSGSLIVGKMITFPAVALGYAGSDQVAFGNPIQFVLDALEVDLVNPS
jgi:hypothetical protein